MSKQKTIDSLSSEIDMKITSFLELTNPELQRTKSQQKSLDKGNKLNLKITMKLF